MLALLFDSVSEGKHVILGMLIVGLVFIGVIAIGEIGHRMNTRRKARRQARRAVY